MIFLYEELKEKGLKILSLPLELAYSIPYDIKVDKLMGTEITTFVVVAIYEN